MLHRHTIALTVAVLGTGVHACTDPAPFVPEDDRILAITIVNSCRVIEVGAQCVLSAQAFADGGFEVRNARLLWSTSRPEVLSVEGESTAAVIRGLRGGTAVVTVAASSRNDVSQQVDVTVVAGNPPPGGEDPQL